MPKDMTLVQISPTARAPRAYPSPILFTLHDISAWRRPKEHSRREKQEGKDRGKDRVRFRHIALNLNTPQLHTEAINRGVDVNVI
jgi:hypothetical protein